MKWFRNSHANVSTVAGCTGNAQCTMHNAQLRKVRAGRRWMAAAAAWVLAAGTLLGSVGVARAYDWAGIFIIDTSGWDTVSKSHVQWWVGHSGYTACSDMTKISNTHLYYYTQGSKWEGATQMGFIAATNNWGSWNGNNDPNYQNAPFYTAKYNGSYGLNAGSHYFFQRASTNNNAAITPDYKDAYSKLNLSGTVGVKVKNYGGSTYSAPSTSPANVTASGYKLTSWTAAGASSLSSSITAGGSTVSATHTTVIGNTVTYAVTSVASGYNFDGWYNGSGTRLSTSTSYTSGFYTNTVPDVYAHFTKYLAPVITDSGATTLKTTQATVTGTVNAGGASTTVTFDYGTNTTYGSTKSVTGSPVAAGSTAGSISAALSSLTPGETYYYKWSASNSGGTATARTGSFTTLPKAPTITSVSATSNSITFTVGANGNGDDTSYKYYLGTDSSASPSTAITAGTATTVTCLPGTTYYIIAEATAGETTETSARTTKATTPAKLTISGVSTTANSITFTVGAGGNGSATTYYYDIYTSSSGSPSSKTCTPGEPVTATVTSTGAALAANTTYYIIVRGYTEAYGAATSKSAKTAAGVIAPTITEGTKSVGTTTASLPITVNMGGGATSQNITLKYSTTSGSYTTSATVSPTTLGADATSASVSGSMSGLTANTTYYYQWTVKNSAGTTTAEGSFKTASVIALSAESWTYDGSNPTATISGGGGEGTYSVTLNSTDPASAGSVSLSGTTLTLTPSKAGTFNITITKAADGIYAAQSKTFALVLSKGDQTISGLSDITKTYGNAAFNLSATSSAGLTVSYTSSATGVATISGKKVTIVGAGTSTITASQSGNDLWNAAANVTATLTVNKAAQTLTFSPASPVFGADVTSYTVTASGNGSPTITYSSGNTAIATINSGSGAMARGTTGYGTVTITAVAAETANYLGKTNTVSVKVMGKRPTSNPTKLTFTATGTTTANIVFQRASDSTGIVIVMRAGAAPTTAPTDGSKPTANTAYGTAGAALGNGYVVYANTGGGSSDYTVNVTGLTAGTKYYVEAYSYQGGASTYSYKSAAKEVIGYTPAAPVTTASATVDGKTMVRLSWTQPSSTTGYGVMIVYGGSAEPTQGTSYSKGNTIGTGDAQGTVIYKGTGTSLEHVVASGTTHNYRFYAYSSANAYSEALEETATTGSFASDEIVDTFSYVSGSDLSGLNGEHGWSGAWSVSGTGPKIVSQTGSSIPVFPNYSQYPDNTGNRIKVAMNSDAASFAATREFPEVTSGNIFAAAIMSYHYAGNKKWCRIALQNDNSAKMAAGRVWESGDDKTIGIDDCNGNRTHGTYSLNPWESSVNNDYLVIMKYDFTSNMVLAKVYYHGEAVPTEEPTTWDVKQTLSASPGKLNKVSLQAGADTGGYTGDVYFDEVRVATSWTKLLARAATKPAAPTSFTVETDGHELVRASVAAAAGNVIIVKNTSATFTAPTDGVAVTVGTTLGDGTVVYKGPVGDIEMVVAAGTTPHFGAYAYNADNYYSTLKKSSPTSLTMGNYPGSCYAAEAFAYTNDTYLTTSTGSQSWMTSGKGWAGAWNLTGVPSSEWSPGKAAKNDSGVEGLLETTQLSGAGGNMLALYPGTTVQSENKAALLKRELTTALASGSTWWGMFTMKISTSAAHSWAGMQLIDASGNVKASIGKLWGGTTAGIEGSATGTSTYGVTAGHSYVYIFKWDGSKMWLHVQHVESTSNPDFSSYSTPNFTDTDDTSVSLSMADITHIQLVAENGRSGDSGTCVGDTWFDEIRFGPSFSALVGGSSTKPAAPTAMTATVDGKEMVRLGWTKNAAGSDVIVVATVTTDGTEPADPAAPADNTSYAVGATVGSTTPSTKVLYKGGATEFEHVVVPGTKAKYAVYSDNGDNLYSSSGLSSGLKTTGPYASGEYVETFSYTNGVEVADSGNSWKGGTACGANYWGSEGSGSWYARKAGDVPAGLTAAVGNYPESAGNAMAVESLGNNQRAVLNRTASLPYGASGSGANNTMYFAYRMAYGYSGVNKWAGLKIRTFDNNVEYSVFVGKVGDATEASTLGIVAKAEDGNEYKCWPLVGAGGTKFGLGGVGDSGGSGNTYLIVGKIRWTATGKANIYANAYWTGGGTPELPENEPEWSSAYWENAKLYGVNSIRLEAGSSDSGNTVGYAYFDELRFAGSWDELLAGKAPVAAWMKGISPTVYIGDTTTHYVYSQPAGAKQSAKVLIRETSATPTAATFVSSGIDAEWVRNYDDPDHAGQVDTEWKVSAQWTSTGIRYVWGSATGNGTTVNSTGSGVYAKDTYTVQALTAPTAFSATADGGYRMTLAWTPYTDASDRTFDEVIVLRYAGAASYNEDDANVTLYPVPVDGTTYMAGDVITKNSRSATVVYRGPGGTFTDTGLTKNTAYYYAVHTANNGYYSARRKATGTTADQAAGDPVIDGRGNDWVGVPSATWNSSTVDEGEFIWTDKKADGRRNTDACYSADIGEFRVKANANTVFFLLRLSTAGATEDGKTVDLENTYVSVGVDTRRSADSTAMNWLGDESATVMGETYYQTNAAIHYPERQMAVHYVAAESAWRIEMYAEDGAKWYAPPTGGNTNVAADAVSGDYCVEWSVERRDLNLTGENTARFTVATFANTKVWNDSGKATADIDTGKSAAVDAMEIAPYGANDGATMGAWDEGLKGGKVNFWADVPFGESGLGSNTAPGEPTTADGSGQGSPGLGWSQPSDGDGFVTGYLFELSETDDKLSGLGGTTENGEVLYRVNLEGAATTAYRPKTTASEFWWRVRARDNGGRLSAGTIRHYNVTGKMDNDGPEPNLLYVGTQVANFLDDPAYRAEVEAEGDALAIVDSVYSEATPGMFGFVLEWTDASGVYATNRSGQSSYTATERYGTTSYATGRKDAYTLGGGEGAFTWNILSAKGDGTVFGRVSPNWDLMLVDTTHQATFNGPQGWTDGANVTNFIVSATKTVDGTTYKTFYPSTTNSLGTVYYTINTGAGPTLKAGDIHWKYEQWLELPTTAGGTVVTSGWTHVYDKDLPFLPSQTLWDSTTYGADANAGVPDITNFVTHAFALPAYDPDVALYLTVSAEDCNTVGADEGSSGWVKWPPDGDQVSYGYYPDGDTPESSGSCLNGPSRARNITTNQLIRIPVRDDDSVGPTASTAVWASAAVAEDGETYFTPTMVVATSAVAKAVALAWASIDGKLRRIDGAGQDVTYQLTDDVIGRPLTFLFNVYDQHLLSGLKYGNQATSNVTTRVNGTDVTRALTNTAFRTRSWNATGYPYSAVESPGAANPQEQGWYVLAGGTYVPTEDTTVQPETTYYTRTDDGWVTSAENVAGFDTDANSTIKRAGDSASHGLGTGTGTVLAWDFPALTEESLSALFGVPNVLDYMGHHSDGVTNLVQLHAWDSDNDREGDQMDTEITFGTLMLTDDDATAPELVGTTAVGTGTNYVHFGDVATWSWGSSSEASLTTATLMSAITAGSSVLGKRASAPPTPAQDDPAASPVLKWHATDHVMYHENKMDGDTYRSDSAKYFEFTVAGDGVTTWASDMLGFHNRVSATGPTKFALTAQAPGLETTENALNNGELRTGWSRDSAEIGTTGSKTAFKLLKTGGGTAYLQTPDYDLSGVTGGTLEFQIGRVSERSTATMQLQYQIGEAAWQNIGSAYRADTTTFADTAANGTWLDGTTAIPAAALGQSGMVHFRWYASDVNGSAGFALYDVSVTLATGDASEVLLGTLELEKNLGDDGAYAATTTDVTLTFNRMVKSSTDVEYKFRLYGYGATTMSDSTVTPSDSGTWGINDFYLHGIASEPKGEEVTDFDIATGTWTNRLEALDGSETGYDTVRSGLWVGNDGVAGRTQLLPTFSMTYPEDYRSGAEVTGGNYVLKAASAATFDTLSEEFESAGAWSFSGGAAVNTEKGWLTLPASESASSASRTFSLTSASGVAGLTVSGTLRVKAATAEGSGGVNGLSVTIAFLDSNDRILYTAPAQTRNTVAAWRNWTLAPVQATLGTAAKVRVTVAQATDAGTEVDVDSLEILVAQWGEEIDAADTAAWNAAVTNGLPAAKFLVGTPELDLTETTVPLSLDLVESGESETGLYRMVGTVHDYDLDRSNDALGTSVTNTFLLHDDDTMAPQWGRMFGGPLGVFLNGTLIPVNKRTGRDQNQKWVVSDNQLAAMAANDSVLFSLSFYDYSGWGTTTLTLGSESVQSGGAAQGNYVLEQGTGEAGMPSATNSWSITARNLYTAHASAFNGTDGSELDMTATVADLDADRADDSMTTSALKVGSVWFVDQDVDAPAFGSQTTPYQGVMLATNVSSYEALQAGSDALAVGGSQSAHATGTPASRSFTLYDGELRKVAPERLFVVTANLNDPRTHSENGRVVSGLQRGTTATGRDSASLWGTSFDITNTYVAFETATAGSSPTMVMSNTVFNDGYSDSIGRTRNANQRGNTSWTWSSFSPEEVGTLLPPEYGTSANPARNLYLNIYAYDSDTDRPGDQAMAALAGPQIVFRDDDTAAPNAPAKVWVNGTEATGRINSKADALPYWTNNLGNLTVEWTAAVDPEPVSPDIKKAGIAGYRLAEDGATITTNAGSALTGTVTNDVSDKVSKTLSGVTIAQGWGNYQLFAVDADDDRPGDGLAGGVAYVPLAFDETPPPEIGYTNVAESVTDGGTESVTEYHRLTANPDDTDDPTTQFDLVWPTMANGANSRLNQLGPDDTKHTKHPTHHNTDYNYLSPWATYKIYYTNYDESSIAAGDDPDSEEDSWVYNTFIKQPTDPTKNPAYLSWKSVVTTNTAADPTAGANPYASLATVSNNAANNQKIRLYDLDFDQHYIVIIVGVDKAGNEGPAGMWSWATNNTIKFAVTQGVIRASSAINTAVGVDSGTNSVGMAPIPEGGAAKAAVLYWYAAGQTNNTSTGMREGAVKKYYDLIYRDAASFNETGTEQWNMASTADNSGTSKTNWNYQADAGLDTPRRMRFYRASYAGRWQGDYPLASEEVYSMNNVVLSEGHNYVSLQGVPYTNTFAAVFGTDTDMWPGGLTASDTNATQVAFFAPGTTEITNEWFFFGSDGKWYDSEKHDVTTVEQPAGFFARPFSLTLPESNAWWDAHGDYDGATYGIDTRSREAKALLWHPILQVPTNSPQASAQTISKAADTYNLLSLNLPVAVHPKDLLLTGIYKSVNPWDADKLYVIDTETKEVRNGSMMYCDPDGTWRWVKNRAEVVGWPILPNDMLVLVSSGNASTDWTWTYSPTNFYKLPDRHMGRKATGGE